MIGGLVPGAAMGVAGIGVIVASDLFSRFVIESGTK
jgi:hypothetical protein